MGRQRVWDPELAGVCNTKLGVSSKVSKDTVLTSDIFQYKLYSHMQGPWAPKKIANPDYFLDESPLSNLGSIGGVAIEIWTMDEGYLFSNVLIANNAAEAEQKRTSLWAPKKEAEVGARPPVIYT